MADSKVTDLTEDTTPAVTDLVYTVKDPAGAPLDRKAQIGNLPFYKAGGTDVAVADGGTGASSASAARTALGLVIGTNVQSFAAALNAVAALTPAADRLPYYTGAASAALTTLTAAGRALLDDADAATQRATLGLVSPIDALLDHYGGVYLPKQSMDRWLTATAKPLRSIVLLGDSITQGAVGERNVTDAVTTSASPIVTSATAAFAARDLGAKIWSTNIPAYSIIVKINSATSVTLNNQATASGTAQKLNVVYDNFVDRVRNYMARTSGPSHAGFYGGWRGDFIPNYAVGVKDQDVTHAKTWTTSASSSPADFAPFLWQQLAPASGATTDALVGATMATTNTSTTVTFSVAVTNLSSANNVGCLIMGAGIPVNTTITAVASTTSITISAPATATASGQNFRIEGPHIMWTRNPDVTVGAVDIIWIDQSNTPGNWSYSTNGGTSWTNVAQTSAAPPLINKTTITTANPATILIRSYNASGAPNVIGTYARMCFVGLIPYSTAPAATVGYTVHNVGFDGNTLTSAIHSYMVDDLVVTSGSPTATSATAHFRTYMPSRQIAGTNIPALSTYNVVNDTTITLRNAGNTADVNATGTGTVVASIGTQAVKANAWLTNTMTGTWKGFNPDLVVVMFSNDMALHADAERYTEMLTWLYREINPYSDLLVVNHFEQSSATGRERDLTNVTTDGTTTITCAAGAFAAGDVGLVVSGTNIPSNQTNAGPVSIASITNGTTVVLSAAATGSSSVGTLTIDRSPNNQANYRTAVKAWCATWNVACLDLYEAYAAMGDTGYTAALTDGLMQDTLHPSALGHKTIGGYVIRTLSLASGV